MADFFYMDGYWLYVWASYALAAVVLAANVITPKLRKRRVWRDLTRRARRERSEP